MNKEITDLMSYYENFKIRFKGSKKWYFITPEALVDKLKGKKIEGIIVKKRTRVWFY